MSATARMPWAPWKYASRASSRKPLDPMMSQIVMSICTGSPPFGLRASSFLETLAPNVTMYRSSYSLRTYRLIREVFPTACSPTKQTLTFIRRGSIMAFRRRRGAKILSARAICEGLFSRFVLRWHRERNRPHSTSETSCGSHFRRPFMSSKQNGHRRAKGGTRKSRRNDQPATSRRLREREAMAQGLGRRVSAERVVEGDSPTKNPFSPLRDGGIRWVFYLWKSDVPEPELARIAWSARAGFLRAAMTRRGRVRGHATRNWCGVPPGGRGSRCANPEGPRSSVDRSRIDRPRRPRRRIRSKPDRDRRMGVARIGRHRVLRHLLRISSFRGGRVPCETFAASPFHRRRCTLRVPHSRTLRIRGIPIARPPRIVFDARDGHRVPSVLPRADPPRRGRCPGAHRPRLARAP